MNIPNPRTARLESVDLLRAIVMILMALDHVRDFMGTPGISPTNLAQATVSLFFTRWITNICAPVFFLLTGTGAYLSLRRYSRAELSRFLFTRGLWLVFLEVVVLRCFAMQFNFDYHLTMLVVIWALGWAMILLSALVYLPNAVVAGFGVVMIAGHNLLDPVQAESLGRLAPLWNVLHAPGLIVANPQHLVFVAYPLIPWVGVTAAGFGLGQIFAWPPEQRKTFLLRLSNAAAAYGSATCEQDFRARQLLTQFLEESLNVWVPRLWRLHRTSLSQSGQLAFLPRQIWTALPENKAIRAFRTSPEGTAESSPGRQSWVHNSHQD
jgi:uncharacterized membrane protein